MGIYFVELGKRIRDIRHSQNLTIEQLSEIIGKSDNFVGNIERGESTPSVQTLIDIANALNIGVDVLLQDYVTAYKNKSNLTVQSPIANKIESLSPEEQKAIWEMIKVMVQFKNA